MNRKSQNLINIIPLQAVIKDAVSRKEADVLYSIWNSTKDKFGNLIVPEHIDSSAIASLLTRGLIKSSFLTQNSVQITDRGREVIRDIILSNNEYQFVKSVVKTSSRNNWLKKWS